MLYGSQSTPAKLRTAGVSLTPTWLSAMAAMCGPGPAAGPGGAAAADSARCAAVRCPAAAAEQFAVLARPQSRCSAAGRPAAQPYGPVRTRCHAPARQANTPVAAPSWNPAVNRWPACADGMKLASAHLVPAAEPTCSDPARMPPTAEPGICRATSKAWISARATGLDGAGVDRVLAVAAVTGTSAQPAAVASTAATLARHHPGRRTARLHSPDSTAMCYIFTWNRAVS